MHSEVNTKYYFQSGAIFIFKSKQGFWIFCEQDCSVLISINYNQNEQKVFFFLFLGNVYFHFLNNSFNDFFFQFTCKSWFWFSLFYAFFFGLVFVYFWIFICGPRNKNSWRQDLFLCQNLVQNWWYMKQ